MDCVDSGAARRAARSPTASCGGAQLAHWGLERRRRHPGEDRRRHLGGGECARAVLASRCLTQHPGVPASAAAAAALSFEWLAIESSSPPRADLPLTALGPFLTTRGIAPHSRRSADPNARARTRARTTEAWLHSARAIVCEPTTNLIRFPSTWKSRARLPSRAVRTGEGAAILTSSAHHCARRIRSRAPIRPWEPTIGTVTCRLLTLGWLVRLTAA